LRNRLHLRLPTGIDHWLLLNASHGSSTAGKVVGPYSSFSA
jgi:hypothetical protein